MKQVDNIFSLTSTGVYDKLMGLPTLHPLVSVVDLKEAENPIPRGEYKYGVYAIFLKKGAQCRMRYGCRSYDYQEGSVVTFAPGASVVTEGDKPDIKPDVVGLLFHSDIAFGTPLAERLKKFNYFDYSQAEALHLSESERRTFLECLDKIKEEASHPVDSHSAALLSANIQVLLEYLDRFYDRQFITRHKINSELVEKFEMLLKDYLQTKAATEGLPSVAAFADALSMSPGYFGDLVKKECGLTAQQIINNRMVALAKERLEKGRVDIASVAYDLGFQYPQHFTRFFKRNTGKSPKEYVSQLSRYTTKKQVQIISTS